jgi:hypothetical protein
VFQALALFSESAMISGVMCWSSDSSICVGLNSNVRKISFGCDISADGRDLLESVEFSPLREPLAGLIGFGNAFCEQQIELPPAAAGAKAFRVHARPQRPAEAAAGFTKTMTEKILIYS